ncbi:copper resistance protein NlpE [Rheinheimera sp. EpRS3]|uniref:copper resistance protein NlpE n=1 Tax=Rheinheimera sp. EpRS3 TaxID=1712383 RepID=UPI0018D2457E|nr:copper resistance protein NlpE [Rheinheimera sp. EpRS3]
MAAILLVAGCDNAAKQTDNSEPAQNVTQPADTTHNARTSLDWAGTYQGMLPCADCEAINTTVTLHADGSYQLERVYVGKSAQVFTEQGVFNWSDIGSTILLEAEQPVQFFVAENQLFMLDKQGKRIEGELAARYRLQKLTE